LYAIDCVLKYLKELNDNVFAIWIRMSSYKIPQIGYEASKTDHT